MNVRLENIHTDVSPTNYVSFLSNAQRNKTRASDRDSIHSVSSIRSVMSGMSSLWSSLRLSSTSASKVEKQKAQLQEDLKYLYSAFTKIPCLRLAPDHKARLISGYEEFPFDSAVPLHAFKNVTALEIYDVDFRQFYGWDRLAENLRSLTVKRAGVDDPADLLINIVLDDVDKRRRRSAKAPSSPPGPWPAGSPTPKHAQLARSDSPPISPTASGKQSVSPRNSTLIREGSKLPSHNRQRSTSPTRPVSSRHGLSQTHGRGSATNVRRSSGSSASSVRSTTPRASSSNLLSMGWLPSTKWRFLRHLSLADNALTNISPSSLAPLADTLQSLDISANLFTEIPDSLATLSCLRALNLSNCMIESLHSLGRNPLPAITTLNLRSNRLTSLAGIERLLSLERVDLRDNKLTDPTEVARLTVVPNMTDIYVHRNPFCKSYSAYRVTIFNLFRKTPGYTVDVTIDATAPNSSERKQLIDRAPELPSVPIVKPPPEDDIPAPAAPPKVVKAIDATEEVQRNSLQRTKSAKSGSQRKKKAPKRRVVELSQNESAEAADMESPAVPTSPPKPEASAPETSALKSTANGVTLEGATRLDAPSDVVAALGDPPKNVPPIDTTVISQSARDFDVTSDLYKKKIEALRQDFGPSWLSALGDEGWDAKSVASFPSEPGFSPALRPTAPRTPSQGIVSGRTLG